MMAKWSISMPILCLLINVMLLAFNVSQGDVFLSTINAVGVVSSTVWLFFWMDGF